MPTIQTIPNTINLAKVNQYLTQGEVDFGTIFGKSFLIKDLPQRIYNVRKSVEWMYFNNPNDPALPAVSNYLLTLCDKQLQAQQIVNGGSSGIQVMVGSGVSVSINSLAPADLDGIVGVDGNAPIAGSSTWVLTDFVGYRVRFTLNDVPVYPKSYNNNLWFSKPTGSNTLTLNGGTFQTGDFYHIEFYQALQDLSPIAIGIEQGGVMIDESGNTTYVET